MAKSKRSGFRVKPVKILTPEAARYQDIQGQDIRGLYRTYRKRAEQRLRDMEAAGMAHLEVYTDYKNRFPTLKEIGSGQGADRQMLYDAMAEVTRFLNMRDSTPGGYHERLTQAAETFQRHYGIEFPDHSQAALGSLMDAIRGASDKAKQQAYYRGWKKSYRKVLAKVEKMGMNENQLAEALRKNLIEITSRGAIKDAETGKYIRGKWNKMG